MQLEEIVVHSERSPPSRFEAELVFFVIEPKFSDKDVWPAANFFFVLSDDNDAVFSYSNCARTKIITDVLDCESIEIYSK